MTPTTSRPVKFRNRSHRNVSSGYLPWFLARFFPATLLVLLTLALLPAPARADDLDDLTSPLAESVETVWKQYQHIRHPLLANLRESKPRTRKDDYGLVRSDFVLENDPFGIGRLYPDPTQAGRPYLFVRVSVFRHLPNEPWQPTSTLRRLWLPVQGAEYYLDLTILTTDRNLSAGLEQIALGIFQPWLQPARTNVPAVPRSSNPQPRQPQNVPDFQPLDPVPDSVAPPRNPRLPPRAPAMP